MSNLKNLFSSERYATEKGGQTDSFHTASVV